MDNKVTLVGTVSTSPYASHQYKSDIIYAFDLMINRNYQQIDIYDTIRVYHTSDKMEVGIRYKIEGHIISSRLNKKPNIAVLVDKITEVNYDTPDDNQLVMTGKVIGLSEPKVNNRDKLYQSMIIRTDKATVRCQSVNKTANYSANQVHVDDMISIEGTLQSDRTLGVEDRNGNPVYYLLGLISYINKEDN